MDPALAYGKTSAVTVTCAECSREYTLEPERVRGVKAARCACGAVIRLGDGMRRLGKYILVKRLAMGGMGEIYYGKIAGIEGFQRDVAIKKMLPHLSADRKFVEMMVKEAKLTVLLNHPNIVQVFDLAKANDEYYIAMEFVPGINVGTLLEDCRRAQRFLPVEVAAHITINVLRGLSYAHDLRAGDGTPMGILHRDITPQNIMVTQDGWVKITDFGIAKARSEISTTRPGMIKGKLGYIAPEQLAGQEPDERLDIFCAGILMWESLASRRLFKGDTEMDTFRLIADARVPPMNSIRSDVPAGLEDVCRKALAKDSNSRFPTASAFCDAITQALFPTTADHCAAAAKKFLHEREDLFQDVYPGLSDSETKLIETGETAIDITTLTQSYRRPRSRRTIALAISLGVVALAAAAAATLRPRADQATPPAPQGAATGSTAPAVPRALSAEEIQLAVDAERTRLTSCYALGPRNIYEQKALGAALVVASTGGVADVLIPQLPDSNAKQCLTGHLRNLRFRAHDQPKLEAHVNLPPPSQYAPQPTEAPPRPLTAGEVQSVVQRSKGAISRCAAALDASQPASVVATLRINTDGQVQEASLNPALAQADAQTCLVNTLKRMRFHRIPDPMVVNLPLQFASGG